MLFLQYNYHEFNSIKFKVNYNEKVIPYLIFSPHADGLRYCRCPGAREDCSGLRVLMDRPRSEEHTSELQSRQYLVCRLLLEKKQPADRKDKHLHYRHDH